MLVHCKYNMQMMTTSAVCLVAGWLAGSIPITGRGHMYLNFVTVL